MSNELNDTCAQLLALGGQEYPYRGDLRGSRVFQMPAWGDSVPPCETNDGKLSLHVTVHPSFSIQGQVLNGSASFKVFGNAGGRWTEILVYSVPLNETIAFLPLADKAGKAMWKAFVAAMKSGA
jgi:hypothetical protein